jgi:hypothetical protein
MKMKIVIGERVKNKIFFWKSIDQVATSSHLIKRGLVCVVRKLIINT